MSLDWFPLWYLIRHTMLSTYFQLNRFVKVRVSSWIV